LTNRHQEDNIASKEPEGAMKKIDAGDYGFIAFGACCIIS
jgi:hypothetical protein